MAQTNIPFGHPLAKKVFGAATFAEMVRAPGLAKNLTGAAPKDMDAKAKLEKMQTSSDYPFVRVTDLSKGAGDTVSVDLFNIIEGKPVMGDEKLSGRMMSLSSNSMDIKINQMRGGIDTGGRMTRQRTVHDLRGLGRANLAGWWSRFMDQVKFVHLAGARGSQNTPDWVVPLASDAEFNDIMINAVQAPTYNRHMWANDATAMTDIGTNDVLTLNDIDKLRAAIDEMDVPMQPVIFPDDEAAYDDPIYVLLVSARVWHHLQTQTGETAWRTFLSNAGQRGTSNPLFKGQPGMWNGILVKKMPRAIRFLPGDAVDVATSSAAFATASQTVGNFGEADTATAIAAGHAVDRSLLLGAQALAEVYGRHQKSGTYMNWHEEETDHGNTLEASVSAMGGVSKLRFKDSQGADYDHGVMVIDSYAKDPRL